MRIQVNVFAQHTNRSGELVWNDDPKCGSDDHIHFEFESKREALAHARWCATILDGGFRSRVAKSICIAVKLA